MKHCDYCGKHLFKDGCEMFVNGDGLVDGYIYKYVFDKKDTFIKRVIKSFLFFITPLSWIDKLKFCSQVCKDRYAKDYLGLKRRGTGFYKYLYRGERK